MSLAPSTGDSVHSPYEAAAELRKHAATALVRPISPLQTREADVARMLPEEHAGRASLGQRPRSTEAAEHHIEQVKKQPLATTIHGCRIALRASRSLHLDVVPRTAD